VPAQADMVPVMAFGVIVAAVSGFTIISPGK